MTARRLRPVALTLLAGLSIMAAQPASAFFGSFSASCRGVRVYDGGNAMVAYCRTVDGAWRFSRIYNCGGAGVRNDNGFLACGT